MKNSESDEKKRAAADLRAIEDLKRNPAYTEYFARRVEEEVGKRRHKILTDRSLSAEELHMERLLYFAVLDTSTMMATDEKSCRSILGPSGEDGD